MREAPSRTELLYWDIVVNPNSWKLVYKSKDYFIFSDTNNSEFFYLSRHKIFFFITIVHVFYSSNNANVFLNPLQAIRFYRAFKKWCALTRNEIKP